MGYVEKEVGRTKYTVTYQREFKMGLYEKSMFAVGGIFLAIAIYYCGLMWYRVATLPTDYWDKQELRRSDRGN